MDRRAKKLEKKRKSRDQAKKNAKALAARASQKLALLAKSAGSAEFGPCYVSAGWDDLTSPALVAVLVTRKLEKGHFVPAIALVDRTCLGVKNGFAREPMPEHELAELIEDVGSAHGGMFRCDLLVAQSIVFHGIDYARSLGFEPHRDFPAALFGPRPAELLPTPWHASERPIYIAGPRDDPRRIVSQLKRTAGDAAFEYIDHHGLPDYEDEDAEEGALVYSPLETTVARDGVSVRVSIYRMARDAGWRLEVEDHLGGSSVWDDEFETDRAALDAALQAIEEEGIASFVVSGADDRAGARPV